MDHTAYVAHLKAHFEARKTARNEAIRRVGKWVAKETGLIIVMMCVTTAIIMIETGHFAEAIKIAAVAGPVKAVAAAVYNRFFH